MNSKRPPRSIPLSAVAAKVDFLRRPDSYPEPTTVVETVQTHMSWLFLTDHYVYKLKKPVRRNEIDHRTLAMRRLGCRREVRLNRRLASDVYLGTVALRATSGQLSLGGRGRTVDWLVRMRRLPDTLTLERALLTDRVSRRDANSIVAQLLPFFADAARARLTPAGYRRVLLTTIDKAAATLARRRYRMDSHRIDLLAGLLRDFVETHAEKFAARARADRVVEGHGDLRPEHIYLTQPPTIIDCIEFERKLRLRDPVEELAFLAMECERSGHPEMDRWLFDAYRNRSGDHPPRELIEFYKAYNAFNRARIAIWHLDDPETGPPDHWIARANDYLTHARRDLGRICQPGIRKPAEHC